MTNKKKIETFEELESLLDQHNVDFPAKWKTKFSTEDRKERIDEKWKDYRIGIYGIARITECLAPIIKEQNELFKGKLTELLQDIKDNNKIPWKKTKDILTEVSLIASSFQQGSALKKKGGKGFFGNIPMNQNFEQMFNKYLKSSITNKNLSLEEKVDSTKFLKGLHERLDDEKENLELEESKLTSKFPAKKETIKNILKRDNYWKMRENITGHQVADRKNEDKYRIEEEQFYKCVMKINEKKYDKKFFSNFEPKSKDLWELYWGFFNKIK